MPFRDPSHAGDWVSCLEYPRFWLVFKRNHPRKNTKAPCFVGRPKTRHTQTESLSILWMDEIYFAQKSFHPLQIPTNVMVSTLVSFRSARSGCRNPHQSECEAPGLRCLPHGDPKPLQPLPRVPGAQRRNRVRGAWSVARGAWRVARGAGRLACQGLFEGSGGGPIQDVNSAVLGVISILRVKGLSKANPEPDERASSTLLSFYACFGSTFFATFWKEASRCFSSSMRCI